MPTYEYECEACGHTFEKFQSITAGTIRRCPSCKKLKVRRLIGAGSAVIFKGRGFYQTDYRSESYRNSMEKENKRDGESCKKAGCPKAADGSCPASAGGEDD